MAHALTPRISRTTTRALAAAITGFTVLVSACGSRFTNPQDEWMSSYGAYALARDANPKERIRGLRILIARSRSDNAVTERYQIRDLAMTSDDPEMRKRAVEETNEPNLLHGIAVLSWHKDSSEAALNKLAHLVAPDTPDFWLVINAAANARRIDTRLMGVGKLGDNEEALFRICVSSGYPEMRMIAREKLGTMATQLKNPDSMVEVAVYSMDGSARARAVRRIVQHATNNDALVTIAQGSRFRDTRTDALSALVTRKDALEALKQVRAYTEYGDIQAMATSYIGSM